MIRGEPAVPRPDPIRAARVVAELDEFLPKALTVQDLVKPKHAQLRDALVHAIEAGIAVEGDKFPSEAELTAISPFSLGTVQKALKSLCDAGFVVRRTGVGTIVRRSDQSMKQPLHCRFAGPDGVFLPVFPKLHSRQPVRGTGPWREALGDEAEVTRLDRRIRIGDKFAVAARFYVDTRRFPLFASRPFRDLHTANFKSLMREEANVRVSRLDHRLSFGAAAAEIAPRIGVGEGERILQINVTAHGGFGDILYYQEIFVPPNDMELTIESRLSDL